MASEPIATDEFQTVVKELYGMVVSRPFRGYGRTIILDLGRLQLVESVGTSRVEVGEACIMLECDWRMEGDHEIVCGSDDLYRDIERCMSRLRDVRIETIDIEGCLPELTIKFSSGLRIRSFTADAGDPRWTVMLSDRTWLSCRDGAVVRGDGIYEPRKLTSDQTQEMELECSTARRWGKPSSGPLTGNCCNCNFFIGAVGNFELCFYGLCMAADSPFDGRVVNSESWCPAFEAQASENALT